LQLVKVPGRMCKGILDTHTHREGSGPETRVCNTREIPFLLLLFFVPGGF
jgi:hypothetical protein